MLTKEEVIILRTIFLEFGDEALRQSRLQFPYENLVVEGSREAKGSHPKANLGTLVETLNSFTNPEIDGIVFDYYLRGEADTADSDVPNLDRLVVVDGRRQIEDVRDWAGDDWKETLDSIIFLKNFSKSAFFIELRMGLYYKGLGDYEKAIQHLSTAREKYLNMLSRKVEQATKSLEEFFDNNYDLETHSFKEGFTPGEDYPVKVELPIDLLCSLEEMPSFHLGEVSLAQGEELSRTGKMAEAQGLFEQSLKYFVESEQVFESIFYGRESEKNPIISPILRELRVVTGFPGDVFRRDYYLQRNLTLLEKKEDLYPIPETDAERRKAVEELLSAGRQTTRPLQKIETIIQNRKKEIRNQCFKKYLFWDQLCSDSQKFILDGLLGQECVDRWVGIVGLAKALEKELIDKILEKLPVNLRENLEHQKRLGIGEFNQLIKEDSDSRVFKILPPDTKKGFHKSLATVGSLRNKKGAHAGKTPSLKDNETVKRILLEGNSKERPLLEAILNLEVVR